MYVILADKTGKTGIVYHPDVQAACLDAWTEWRIDLKEFSAQGVNLANVERLILGFGNKAAPKSGGMGLVYFDDLRLYLPGQAQ